MTKEKPKGITRIEIPAKSTFGYMVRIRRGTHSVHEFFPDAKHKGKEGARAAAQHRYDELASTAPTPQTSHKGVLTSRNTSGKVGVRVSVSYGRPGSDGEYFAWEAFWNDANGNYRTISFSWNKFGDETAHQLAVLARDNGTTDRPTIYSLYQQQTGKKIVDERIL